jgi:hypothetical protein
VLSSKKFENLYIDVPKYQYAHGHLADSPDDDCGWINSSLTNMVNNDASSKIVTGYTASPTNSHGVTPLKHTLVTGFKPTD